MRIQTPALSLILVALSPLALRAQTRPVDAVLARSEVAVMFTYTRTTTTFTNPGQSGGFSLAGVTATGAYRFRPKFSALLDFSGSHINGVQNTGQNMTLLTYLAGARYTARPVFHGTPFVQVLAGFADAYGTIYPATAYTSGGASGFAGAAGGGFDYPVNHRISLRAQTDYLYTALPNTTDNRQGSFRALGGLVVQLGKK